MPARKRSPETTRRQRAARRARDRARDAEKYATEAAADDADRLLEAQKRADEADQPPACQNRPQRAQGPSQGGLSRTALIGKRKTLRETFTNLGQYLERYQPATWAKWVHLMLHHQELADKPCGCPAVLLGDARNERVLKT